MVSSSAATRSLAFGLFIILIQMIVSNNRQQLFTIRGICRIVRMSDAFREAQAIIFVSKACNVMAITSQ